MVFRELSRALFRFSRDAVGLFAHISSSEDIMIFHKNSSKIHISGASSDQQPYVWASGENWLAAPKKQFRINGKLFLKARKNYGGHFGESIGVFGFFSPSKTGVFGLKNPLRWAQKYFPMIVGLKAVSYAVSSFTCLFFDLKNEWPCLDLC